MPFININTTDEEVTYNQKKNLIAGITTLVENVLGVRPEDTMIVINEIALDNAGLGGLGVREFRKNNAPK